jgi:hypothetical protein
LWERDTPRDWRNVSVVQAPPSSNPTSSSSNNKSGYLQKKQHLPPASCTLFVPEPPFAMKTTGGRRRHSFLSLVLTPFQGMIERVPFLPEAVLVCFDTLNVCLPSDNPTTTIVTLLGCRWTLVFILHLRLRRHPQQCRTCSSRCSSHSRAREICGELHL